MLRRDASPHRRICCPQSASRTDPPPQRVDSVATRMMNDGGMPSRRPNYPWRRKTRIMGRCVEAKSCLHLQADLATPHRPRARSGVGPAASDGCVDGHPLRAAEEVGEAASPLGRGICRSLLECFLFFDESGGARPVDLRIPMVRME